MAKLDLKRVLCGVLVMALIAPVVLATGSGRFRPAAYGGTVLGVPAFPLLVIATLLVLLVLVWVFAAGAFGEAADEEGGR